MTTRVNSSKLLSRFQFFYADWSSLNTIASVVALKPPFFA
ncbi:hypothetical protein ACZ87_03254, partial [Candidatus Erwinia dacicola]